MVYQVAIAPIAIAKELNKKMGMTSRTQRLKNRFTLADKAPDPYGSDLHTIVNLDFSRITEVTEVPFTFVNQQFKRADVAHWIIKFKINPDYKHPMGKDADSSKTYADVYAAVFDACRDLHSFGGGDNYKNASQWFALILYEFAICRSNAIGKKAAIAEIRRKTASLTDMKLGGGYGNGEKMPLYEVFDPQSAKHTHNLFATLLTPIKDKNFNALRVRLLNNILAKMKAFASWCDKNVDGVFCCGNKEEFLQFGRGKAREKLQKVLLDPEITSQLAS